MEETKANNLSRISVTTERFKYGANFFSIMKSLETLLKGTKDLRKYGTLYAVGTDEEIMNGKKAMPTYIKNFWNNLEIIEYFSILYFPIIGITLYNDLIGKKAFISLMAGGLLGLFDGLARMDNKKDKFQSGGGLIGKIRDYVKNDLRKDFPLD